MRPTLFIMVNRSKKCKFCRKETVFPIKYRKKPEKRSWRRAFLVCINCHICTDFLDSKHNSIMPYYNDINVLKVWKLKGKKRILRIFEIKRDKNIEEGISEIKEKLCEMEPCEPEEDVAAETSEEK